MCDTCGQRFAHVSYLKSHQRLHNQDRPYACQECAKKFTHATSLRHHVAVLHADAGQHEQFSCHQCGRSFPTISQVRMHVRSHVTEESTDSLECRSCGEVAESAAALAQHLLAVHGGLGSSNVFCDARRQYACNVCGRFFSQPGNLRRHVQTHTGQRPSQCTVCGKKFTQPANLKAHLRTHSGERPFSCFGCGISFADKSTLRKHTQHHCYMMSTISSTDTAAIEPHNVTADTLDAIGTAFTETVGYNVDDIAFCGFV